MRVFPGDIFNSRFNEKTPSASVPISDVENTGMLHWALARDHLVSWAFNWPGSKLNILKYKSFRLHLFWGVLFLNIRFGPSKIVYHWPERPLTFKT